MFSECSHICFLRNVGRESSRRSGLRTRTLSRRQTNADVELCGCWCQRNELKKTRWLREGRSDVDCQITGTFATVTDSLCASSHTNDNLYCVWPDDVWADLYIQFSLLSFNRVARDPPARPKSLPSCQYSTANDEIHTTWRRQPFSLTDTSLCLRGSGCVMYSGHPFVKSRPKMNCLGF